MFALNYDRPTNSFSQLGRYENFAFSGTCHGWGVSCTYAIYYLIWIFIFPLRIPLPLLPPDNSLYILPITFPYFIPGLLWESEMLACFFCCTFKRFQDMKNLHNKVILLHMISKLFTNTYLPYLIFHIWNLRDQLKGDQLNTHLVPYQ